MPDATRVGTISDERAEEARRNQGPLDNETSAVLTRVYLARRLEYQLDYYRAKEREYTRSSDAAFKAGAIIMTITSLLAALGVNGDAPSGIRLLTAILPALAALVASFRSLYQWDQQAQLFKDTALGLERAKLVLPDMDQVDTKTAANIFPELVSTTELVFEDEVNQWGQIALGAEDKEGESDANIEQFAREYGLDVFDENGKVDPEKMGQFKEILAVAQSSGSSSSTSVSVEYPAMGAGAGEQPAPSTEPASATTVASDEADQEAEIEPEEDHMAYIAGEAGIGGEYKDPSDVGPSSEDTPDADAPDGDDVESSPRG
ncbi:MAG: SLATT domain-containing protein [Chloroflexota bacterium]